MKYAYIHLNDLPDEILLIIFKKLSNIDVLYSLIGVNKRLNKIVSDSIFTNSITLIRCLSNDIIYPLPSPILERFCLQILPSIHHKIKWLNIQVSCIERVLLCTDYPNLFGLGLYNFGLEKTKQLLNDNSLLNHIFKNQIVSLTIDISRSEESNATFDINAHLLQEILTMFRNLQHLNIVPFTMRCREVRFDMLSPMVFSSNLLELHINLHRFTDCLYILDGRFNQLRIFYVNIYVINQSNLIIDNQEKLPNLKCFSLECDRVGNVYDELIVSLIHRMSNLEELNLYFTMFGRKTFIEGNQLKNIINYIPRLNKFMFNIRSEISVENQINLPLNEDIQYTFKNLKNNKIISSIEYSPKEKHGQCHVYSYPYIWKDYNNITNHFSGGLFKCVRQVSLYDERPFNHEFFLRIAQSFPFLKKISIDNNNQQCRKSDDDNKNLTIIQYPYLTELDLLDAHQDYVEQFLIDNKTCLPDNVYLYVHHEMVKKVTYNFKRDETRNNYSKIRYRIWK